jgi:hypothetical protein
MSLMVTQNLWLGPILNSVPGDFWSSHPALVEVVAFSLNSGLWMIVLGLGLLSYGFYLTYRKQGIFLMLTPIAKCPESDGSLI